MTHRPEEIDSVNVSVYQGSLVIFSAVGGVDIEELAQRQPALVRKEHFTVASRLPVHRAREIVAEAGISGKLLLGLAPVLSTLADVFLDYDATVDKVAVIMNVVSNTRVDLVARGIVKGIIESGKNPAQTVAVFRVPGAWEDEGSKILSKYAIPIQGRTVSIDEAAGIAAKNAH